MSNDLIYICNNNGSDTRIAKEVDTLCAHFNIHFLGFAKANYHAHEAEKFASHRLIQGAIRSPRASLAFLCAARQLLARYPHASVHVVNEQLALLLAPLLIKRPVVVDSFDSMFLRMNKPSERAILLKKIVYGLASTVIVTDDNRHNLLPNFAKPKSIVIPNVPKRAPYPAKNTDKNHLTLCYFGALAQHRGSSFIRALLDENPMIRCIAAGWVIDDYSQDLLTHDRVDFRGSMTQEAANRILAEHGDYLVAVYPLNNQNNINASPNKIYDAIHTKTPLIISQGLIVSDQVTASGIGLSFDTENLKPMPDIVAELLDKRGTFHFSDQSAAENSWECFEPALLASHGLTC